MVSTLAFLCSYSGALGRCWQPIPLMPGGQAVHLRAAVFHSYFCPLRLATCLHTCSGALGRCWQPIPLMPGGQAVHLGPATGMQRSG